jgi:tRNA dimethylallyltransferase
MKQKTCIVICGPTASGKTDIAIDVAKHFHTQIISADSRQCFTELSIGVAKPSLEQLTDTHHYFINSHSTTESISAADFEQYALGAINDIFKTNDIAVMVGGTGLYIKAFCEGLDDIPQTDPLIKKEIIENYTLHGTTWLQEKIQQEDPLYYEKGEIQNPQRMMRALEVIRNTGKSIIIHQQKIKKERDFTIVKIGIEIPRPILYERINTRVDKMMAQGLEKEARAVHAQKNLNALQTVGYRELFDYFENNITLEKAVELVKQNTRHYAKRQITWFKKDEDVIWLQPSSVLPFIMQKFR